MMMGGMALMFFWMALGALLFLVLIAAVIWLVVGASHSQSRYSGPPWQPMNTPSWHQPEAPGYSQGYAATMPGSETSKDEQTSSYAEQPSLVEYPQEIHQEQRFRF